MEFRRVLFRSELVQVLAVIHDSANRRVCSGRDFDEIQTSFFRNLDCRLGRQNAELLVVIVNDANFSGPDPVIHPDVFIDNLAPPECIRPSRTNGNLNKRRRD